MERGGKGKGKKKKKRKSHPNQVLVYKGKSASVFLLLGGSNLISHKPKRREKEGYMLVGFFFVGLGGLFSCQK